MIEELSKIGDIDSANDFFEFKISIKTIIILIMLWGIIASIIVVIMFGGINNTIDYVTNIIESTKKSIVIHKDKLSNVKNSPSTINDPSSTINEPTHKNDD